MAYNSNYGFKYPKGDDFYNVEDFNGNFDKTADELDNIKTAVEGKANAEHTHNYAGSKTPGGAASSAVCLDEYIAINLTKGAVGSFDSFDGSEDVNISVEAINPDYLNKVVPVSKGGTGSSTKEGARSSLGLGKAAVCGTTDNYKDNNSNLITSKGVYNAIENHSHNLNSESISGELPLNKMKKGSDGYILQAKGTSDPIWTDPKNINTGNADVARYIEGLDSTNWNCDELWSGAAFYSASGTNKVESGYKFIRRMNTANNGSIAFVDKEGEANAGGNLLNIIIDGGFYQNGKYKVLDETSTAPSGGDIYPVQSITASEPSSVAKGKVVYVVE